ncbi:MAG TPA: hypothetical protein VD884_12195 [Ohtaekwangia sp.]|nr:hypothetical protein [Ohtaekwangia sp.]
MVNKGEKFTVALLLSMVLVGYAVMLKKPAYLNRGGEEVAVDDAVPPLVLYTGLQDTLSESAITELGLTAPVTGIKFLLTSGRYASYYEYQADPEQVLAVVASIPFSRSSIQADMTCRRISYRDLEVLRSEIPPGELDRTAYFWYAAENEIEIYESIKPPLRHTLLINRATNHVMHRASLVI